MDPLFFFSEARYDLINTQEPLGKDSLHGEFRAGMKLHGAHPNGFQMRLHRANRHQDRCLYFQVAVIGKPLPDRGQDTRPLAKGGRIHVF